MPDVDSKLATSLRQAKQQPMFFAFVAKGSTDGVLLLSKKKIPVKEINEAKQESGGKKVFKGRCQGEDGRMVFELAKEPPSTLAKQLKAVIHESAGMMMQVDTRIAPDFEEETDETEAEQADDAIPDAPPLAPPPPNDLAGRFTGKLKALAPVMQKLDGATSPEAKEARQAIAEADALFKAKNYNDALETLDIAEGLLKQALLKSVKAPPAPPPPPPKPPADPAATRFAARLKALAPVLQKADATGNDHAKQAKLQIAEANKHYIAKQFDQANASLDQAEQQIKQALIAATQAPPQTSPPQAPPTPSTANDASAQFTARLKALTPAYQAAAAASPEHKPALDRLVAQAMASAKARQFAEGLTQLDELEAALATAKPADEAPDNELIAEVEAVLKSLRPKLKRAMDAAGRSEPNEAAALDALFNSALAEHQAENYAKAYDQLTSLDARVTAFLRNAKAQAEVRQAAGPENVAFLASKQEWDKARAGAKAELAKFQNAVLNDAATKEDPRYADSIVPTVKGLDSVLQQFDDRINAALDEAAAVPAQQKGPPIQKALDLIGEYRQAISSNQMIGLIDSGAYGAANIGGVLNNALDTMAKRLRKRLKAL